MLTEVNPLLRAQGRARPYRPLGGMFMRGVRLIPVALAVTALIAWAAPALGDEVHGHFDLSWGEPRARIGRTDGQRRHDRSHQGRLLRPGP